jgi:hypothetical protein
VRDRGGPTRAGAARGCSSRRADEKRIVDDGTGRVRWRHGRLVGGGGGRSMRMVISSRRCCRGCFRGRALVGRGGIAASTLRAREGATKARPAMGNEWGEGGRQWRQRARRNGHQACYWTRKVVLTRTAGEQRAVTGESAGSGGGGDGGDDEHADESTSVARIGDASARVQCALRRIWGSR